MTDFEKKTSATENTTGMCHLKISLCPHKKQCPAVGTETEDCSGHGRKLVLKGHMLKVKHTMPVYMARTKLLYFDSNTEALSRETISTQEIQPTTVISK